MDNAERHRAVVWGGSGHALVVADILSLTGYRLEGFLDSIAPERRGERFGGSQILGGAERLAALREAGCRFLALGVGNNRARAGLAAQALVAGFTLPVLVHPRAVVAGSAVLGNGTLVAAGAIVNPACRIGDNVILNTASSIDHECIVGDAAHIAPGVHMAGRVVIEAGAFVGVGTTIRDRVRIGADSIIGAGSVVLHDIPTGVIAYGNPARVVRPVANQSATNDGERA